MVDGVDGVDKVDPARPSAATKYFPTTNTHEYTRRVQRERLMPMASVAAEGRQIRMFSAPSEEDTTQEVTRKCQNFLKMLNRIYEMDEVDMVDMVDS